MCKLKVQRKLNNNNEEERQPTRVVWKYRPGHTYIPYCWYYGHHYQEHQTLKEVLDWAKADPKQCKKAIREFQKIIDDIAYNGLNISQRGAQTYSCRLEQSMYIHTWKHNIPVECAIEYENALREWKMARGYELRFQTDLRDSRYCMNALSIVFPDMAKIVGQESDQTTALSKYVQYKKEKLNYWEELMILYNPVYYHLFQKVPLEDIHSLGRKLEDFNCKLYGTDVVKEKIISIANTSRYDLMRAEANEQPIPNYDVATTLYFHLQHGIPVETAVAFENACNCWRIFRYMRLLKTWNRCDLISVQSTMTLDDIIDFEKICARHIEGFRNYMSYFCKLYKYIDCYECYI